MKTSNTITTALTVILMIFGLQTAYAGGPKFQKKMGEILQGMGSAETMDDLQAVANQFGTVAKAEPTEWLPLYYQAQCNILMSFQEKDATQRDIIIDAAESQINAALLLDANNAELYALQGFMYTARLVVNPMQRGQKYGTLSATSLERALAIDPENPRAHYLKLSNAMGTAQFFGSDVSQYCTDAQALLEKWDAYPMASRIHPQWGKGQVQELAGSCD